ncbi:MAG: hypothetical protein ABIG56_01085 [Candidatus Omnitrophota bacterium]
MWRISSINRAIFLSIALLIWMVNTHSYAGLRKYDTSIGWEEWHKGVSGYLFKVEKILERFEQSRDEAKGLSVSVLKELERVNPPTEFLNYHSKIIEAYKLRRESSDALFKGDSVTAQIYDRKAIDYDIKSMEELKQIYSSHNAPRSLIIELDFTISILKRLLASKQDQESLKEI